MTLGFSTKINGQQNYFVEKILASFPESRSHETVTFLKEYYKRFPSELAGKTKFVPKLHTIRADTHDRWQPGCTIHPVVCNRTKKRFQFAPAMNCISTQMIRVISRERRVFVLDKDRYSKLSNHAVYELALNDGFDSVNDFFAYFSQDFLRDLKLIHWTDLKY